MSWSTDLSRDGGMEDPADLKSASQYQECGFESRSRHQYERQLTLRGRGRKNKTALRACVEADSWRMSGQRGIQSPHLISRGGTVVDCA